MVIPEKTVTAVRAAIESMYDGKCTVTEYNPVTDPVTKITKHVEDNVHTDKPCHLSYKNIINANSTATGSILTQIIKLFIAPEVAIKPGSKITVTQNGITTEYKDSGEPAIYSTHQEIVLKLFDGWS
jgi:hypothetical protein